MLLTKLVFICVLALTFEVTSARRIHKFHPRMQKSGHRMNKRFAQDEGRTPNSNKSAEKPAIAEARRQAALKNVIDNVLNNHYFNETDLLAYMDAKMILRTNKSMTKAVKEVLSVRLSDLAQEKYEFRDQYDARSRFFDVIVPQEDSIAILHEAVLFVKPLKSEDLNRQQFMANCSAELQQAKVDIFNRSLYIRVQSYLTYIVRYFIVELKTILAEKQVAFVFLDYYGKKDVRNILGKLVHSSQEKKEAALKELASRIQEKIESSSIDSLFEEGIKQFNVTTHLESKLNAARKRLVLQAEKYEAEKKDFVEMVVNYFLLQSHELTQDELKVVSSEFEKYKQKLDELRAKKEEIHNWKLQNEAIENIERNLDRTTAKKN